MWAERREAPGKGISCLCLWCSCCCLYVIAHPSQLQGSTCNAHRNAKTTTPPADHAPVVPRHSTLLLQPQPRHRTLNTTDSIHTKRATNMQLHASQPHPRPLITASSGALLRRVHAQPQHACQGFNHAPTTIMNHSRPHAQPGMLKLGDGVSTLSVDLVSAGVGAARTMGVSAIAGSLPAFFHTPTTPPTCHPCPKHTGAGRSRRCATTTHASTHRVPTAHVRCQVQPPHNGGGSSSATASSYTARRTSSLPPPAAAVTSSGGSTATTTAPHQNGQQQKDSSQFDW